MLFRSPARALGPIRGIHAASFTQSSHQPIRTHTNVPPTELLSQTCLGTHAWHRPAKPLRTRSTHPQRMFTLTVYVQPSHRRASRAAAKVQGAEPRKRAAGYRPHPKGVYAANHTASGPKGQQAQPRMSGLSLASQPDEYKASTWRHVKIGRAHV